MSLLTASVGLPVCFQASALCTRHPVKTGTAATFPELGFHFHSVLGKEIIQINYS